jgi:hypothetical protein
MAKKEVKLGWFEHLESLMADKPREFTVSLYPDNLEPEPITSPEKWRDDVIYISSVCTQSEFPKFIKALRAKYPEKIIRYGHTGGVVHD